MDLTWILPLLFCIFSDAVRNASAATRLNILTVLNGKTFKADQQSFARALNLKNHDLRKQSQITLHSTEIATTSGLSAHLKDLCNAVDNAASSWLAVVNLAEPAALFASVMVGQQWGLPVLGHVGTLQAEMFKDLGEETYVPMNPGVIKLAQIVAHFIKGQRWQTPIALIKDRSYSSTVFFEELKRLEAVSETDVITLTNGSSTTIIHSKLARLKDRRNRVHVVFCDPFLTRAIFEQATKLQLTNTGWVWLITDRSYTTDSAILQDFPLGTFAIRTHEPNLTQIVGRALDGVVAAAKAISANAVNKLQDKNLVRLDCFGEVAGPKLPQDLSDALITYRRKLQEFFQTTEEGVDYEVQMLVTKRLKHRWSHLGNLSTNGSPVSGGILAGERLLNLEPTRDRLRVATRITHPFIIEDQPYTEEGDCQQTTCIRVRTKSKLELMSIMASYESGLLHATSYNVTCCKGLAVDLLQALSRDVGFDFDLYLVQDDKDGTHLETGLWDGIIGDIKSGAAHMGVGPITVTQARKRIVDFSSPFFYSKFSFLVATTKAKIKLSAFLEPFSWKLWIAIFSALHATAVAAAIFEWVSPFGLNPRGRMRRENFTLATALTTVYSLFFSHVMAFKAPKSWPNKVLINFWGSFCFIILASYTANHAAIYAGLSQKPNFDNIFDNEDLLQRKVATIQGSSAEVFIRNINKDLHDHMRRNGFFNVVSVDDAVEKLKSGQLDAFVYDTALLEYIQANDTGCTLKTAGAAFGSQGYAVAFPKGSKLRYMDNGFMDDLNAKWFGNLQCHGRSIDRHEPRALGLEDFAGVFVLLAVGGAVGLVILGLEHMVYRMLPLMRQTPKDSVWHSQHVMFFSQKLYRFVNSVDLVSPNSSAKEFATSLKQGQFIGMFQKSVKKRAKEEALQAKRSRNAENFFETINELRRNLRETSARTQDFSDLLENDLKEPEPVVVSNGILRKPNSLYKTDGKLSRNNTVKKSRSGDIDLAGNHRKASKLSRQERVLDPELEAENFIRSFPELKGKLNSNASEGTRSVSLEDGLNRPRSITFAPAVDVSDDDQWSPAEEPPERTPVDDSHPYTSLMDWEDVDIEEVPRQDLIKMWQSAECDLRSQIQRLEKERSALLLAVKNAKQGQAVFDN